MKWTSAARNESRRVGCVIVIAQRLVVRFLYPPGRTVKIIINRESQHTESKNRKEFRGKNKKKTKTKNLN
jgi:hypothetical protein